MVKPIAVVISDIHYSLNTYQLADTALRLAINEASRLCVPLIDCGDITNDKAILRAECVNALLDTMDFAIRRGVSIFCLVGNHSLLNEKGKDHALNFLKNKARVIEESITEDNKFNFIPYQSNPDDFYRAIQQFPKGSIVFGHQGTKQGFLGDYVKDSSAVDHVNLKDWKVFLGHYHRHYELGTTVSIGNPYTLTFGEASDGPKGYIVVFEDGSYERRILNLRKHIVIERTMENVFDEIDHNDGDLIWIKVKGTISQLNKLTKKDIEDKLGIKNFKFDKIYEDRKELKITKSQTGEQILDSLIGNLDESDKDKKALKKLWRDLLV